MIMGSASSSRNFLSRESFFPSFSLLCPNFSRRPAASWEESPSSEVFCSFSTSWILDRYSFIAFSSFYYLEVSFFIMPARFLSYTSSGRYIWRISCIGTNKNETYQKPLPLKKTSDKSRHLKPSHGHAPMLLTSLHGSRPENCRSTALTTPLLPIMLSRTGETVKILFSGVFMFL